MMCTDERCIADYLTSRQNYWLYVPWFSKLYTLKAQRLLICLENWYYVHIHYGILFLLYRFSNEIILTQTDLISTFVTLSSLRNVLLMNVQPDSPCTSMVHMKYRVIGIDNDFPGVYWRERSSGRHWNSSLRFKVLLLDVMSCKFWTSQQLVSENVPLKCKQGRLILS